MEAKGQLREWATSRPRREIELLCLKGYAKGLITDTRLDVPSLELQPLGLVDHGIWNPDEESELFEPGAHPVYEAIRAAGPRRWYEMEQVLPEDAVELEWEEDPILEAVELAATGAIFDAEDLLGDLLTADLRCLDGYGVYLWRRGDLAGAADVFRRLLWLNPHDNTGARFNLAAVEAGQSWEAPTVHGQVQ